MAVPLSDITVLLHAWGNGDSEALDRLTSLVYEELYRLAQRHMAREKPDHILSAFSSLMHRDREKRDVRMETISCLRNEASSVTS
jgi:hypothetical protein